MIKCYVHDGRTFVTPIWVTSKEMADWFSKAGHAARNEMKAKGAAHAIYGTRKYDPETGALIEADVYAPAVLLDDAEFDRRVEAFLSEYPGSLILSHHNF